MPRQALKSWQILELNLHGHERVVGIQEHLRSNLTVLLIQCVALNRFYICARNLSLGTERLNSCSRDFLEENWLFHKKVKKITLLTMQLEWLCELLLGICLCICLYVLPPSKGKGGRESTGLLIACLETSCWWGLPAFKNSPYPLSPTSIS